MQRQRARGCVGERNCPGSCEPGGGPRALARAAQVYAGSKDAGSLRGGRQVSAGCSASVGKDVGCKDVPRLWSKAPGDVFSAAEALCKRREAAGWSAGFGEETNYGAHDAPWGKQGLWDTWDCRLG